MYIIRDKPPLFDEIDAAFHVAGKPVIFTWGELIYNPMGIRVTPELVAHESVHCSRQRAGTSKIEAWWKRYIADMEFRLAEEIPAHRAEYLAFEDTHKDGNQRARYLELVSSRLASPLYGVLNSPREAKRLILLK